MQCLCHICGGSDTFFLSPGPASLAFEVSFGFCWNWMCVTCRKGASKDLDVRTRVCGVQLGARCPCAGSRPRAGTSLSQEGPVASTPASCPHDSCGSTGGAPVTSSPSSLCPRACAAQAACWPVPADASPWVPRNPAAVAAPVCFPPRGETAVPGKRSLLSVGMRPQHSLHSGHIGGLMGGGLLPEDTGSGALLAPGGGGLGPLSPAPLWGKPTQEGSGPVSLRGGGQGGDVVGMCFLCVLSCVDLTAGQCFSHLTRGSLLSSPESRLCATDRAHVLGKGQDTARG